MAAIMEAYSPDCITLRGNGPIPEARHLPIGVQARSREPTATSRIVISFSYAKI